MARVVRTPDSAGHKVREGETVDNEAGHVGVMQIKVERLRKARG